MTTEQFKCKHQGPPPCPNLAHGNGLYCEQHTPQRGGGGGGSGGGRGLLRNKDEFKQDHKYYDPLRDDEDDIFKKT